MTSRSIAVCIVTNDRVDELTRCLEAIFAADVPPSEVIVSDDGRAIDRSRAVTDRFGSVRYVRPTARGYCAARNAAARAATTSHVSFIDDDGVLGADFISRALRVIEDLDDHTIVSGAVSEGGRLLTPKSPTFLGHHEKRPDGLYRNIQMNSNLFPRSAFLHAVFDEAIVYGHDEVDAAAGLIARGYRIVYVPELVNLHRPPPRSPAQDRRRRRLTRRSRFYVGLKRYLVWDRRPGVALAFLLVAPCHQAAHEMRNGRPREVPEVFADMSRAAWDVARMMARLRRSAQPWRTAGIPGARPPRAS